jgi:hypothetical protein
MGLFIVTGGHATVFPRSSQISGSHAGGESAREKENFLRYTAIRRHSPDNGHSSRTGASPWALNSTLPFTLLMVAGLVMMTTRDYFSSAARDIFFPQSRTDITGKGMKRTPLVLTDRSRGANVGQRILLSIASAKCVCWFVLLSNFVASNLFCYCGLRKLYLWYFANGAVVVWIGEIWPRHRHYHWSYNKARFQIYNYRIGGSFDASGLKVSL